MENVTKEDIVTLCAIQGVRIEKLTTENQRLKNLLEMNENALSKSLVELHELRERCNITAEQ